MGGHIVIADSAGVVTDIQNAVPERDSPGSCSGGQIPFLNLIKCLRIKHKDVRLPPVNGIKTTVCLIHHYTCKIACSFQGNLALRI